MIHGGLCTAVLMIHSGVCFLPHRHGTSSHVHPYAVQHLPSPSHSGTCARRSPGGDLFRQAQWDLHLPGSHPQVSWPPLSLSLLFSTVGSTYTWLAPGELATPIRVPTLQHSGIYIYLAHILRWVGHPYPSPCSSAHWDLHLPGLHPQVSWPPLSLSLLFSTLGSTSTWLASSGDLGAPLPLPTLQHNRIYVYLARSLRWVGHPSPSPCCSSLVVTQLLRC